ncbi:aquaporin family protein [Macrococcus hajekii]|uniref:Aquaporin family protein n=1 Tax=Macrococcus hajekii TaxID=198482 RepID=A0A4R6BMZ8_9STAP|nr:MIP/aquaporin family protein [Macrococcus hajekii]TDM03118.1 aquaporin family protein [Macrococcus hajekii]GGA96123.1 glycerol transporter [Macrococcus hajekii]
MSEFLAELVGTAILILFGAGVCANVNLKGSYANNGGWIVIAFGWGLAVVMGVYAVGSITGAHLNPAVSIGLAVDGAFPWEKVPMYIAAQMLGAMLGALLTWLHFMPHFKAEEDVGTKLGVFSTGPAYPNYVANFISEIIGTTILVMGLLFIGANKFTDGLNPLIVGALIVAIGLSLGGTTGYAINPARDLGPRLAHAILPIPGKGSSNWAYAIVPVLGPIAGGMLGATLYHLLFKGEIEMIGWISLLVTALTIVLGFVMNKTVLKGQQAKLL